MTYDIWIDDVLTASHATLGDAIAAAQDAQGGLVTVEWEAGGIRYTLTVRDGAETPMRLDEEAVQ